jgi:hypothetical protein
MAHLQGAERILVRDSESSCGLLQPRVAEVPLESTTFEAFGVTGDSLDIKGEQQVSFQMGSHLQSFIFVLQIANIRGWYYRTEFLNTATG